MSQQAALEQRALEQLRRGDLRGAHATLTNLLRLRPKDAGLKHRIDQVGQLIKQREQAQERIHAEPLRYAHAYIKAGRLAEGLQLLRATLAKDPNNQRLRGLALEVARRLRAQVQNRGPNEAQPASAPTAPSTPPAPARPDDTAELRRVEAARVQREQLRQAAQAQARLDAERAAKEKAEQEAKARTERARAEAIRVEKERAAAELAEAQAAAEREAAAKEAAARQEALRAAHAAAQLERAAKEAPEPLSKVELLQTLLNRIEQRRRAM